MQVSTQISTTGRWTAIELRLLTQFGQIQQAVQRASPPVTVAVAKLSAQPRSLSQSQKQDRSDGERQGRGNMCPFRISVSRRDLSWSRQQANADHSPKVLAPQCPFICIRTLYQQPLVLRMDRRRIALCSTASNSSQPACHASPPPPCSDRSCFAWSSSAAQPNRILRACCEAPWANNGESLSCCCCC